MDGVNVDSLFKAIMRIHIEKVRGTELFDILEKEDLDEEKKKEQNSHKETLIVMKQGVKCKVEIDMEKNNKIQQKLKKMLNKNTCTDIFKHSMVSKGNQRIRMYEHKTNKRYFRDKMIKNNLIIL